MDRREELTLRRRNALAALVGVGSAATAGCIGSGDESEPTRPGDDNGEPPRQDGDDWPATPDDTQRDGIASPPPERVTFISGAEIESIAAAIDEEEQPWAYAYLRFQETLESAMTAEPRSVVDSGVPAAGSSPHQFGTDAPYQDQDGVHDPDTNRADVDAANAMGHWIRNTALAYALTEEDRYAERAIDLLHHWCLDPETKMEPTTRNHTPHTPGFRAQWEIDLYISIPAMFYGASLVAEHPYWDEVGGVGALDEWAAAFLESAETRGVANGSNGTSWRAMTWITMAAYLDDREALTRGYRFWAKGFLDLTEEGHLEHELSRTRSLQYTMFALEAMVNGAAIARLRGTDLYAYSPASQDGSAVRTIADTHAPFVLDPSTWDHEQLVWTRSQDRAAAMAYELVNSRWPEQRYLDVIEQVTRPVERSRILGNVTLTHADTFAHDIDFHSDRRQLATEFDAAIERQWVEPGATTTVTASVYNPSSVELTDVAVTVAPTDDAVGVGSGRQVDVERLAEEESETMLWDVSFPAAAGEYGIGVEVAYEKDGEPHTLSERLSCEVVGEDARDAMWTDFSDAAIGTSPSEWTPRWSADESNWEITEAPGDAAGHALRFASDRSGRRTLSWDAVPAPVRDVEVLASVYVPELTERGNHARIHVRAGCDDDAGVETGYYFDLREEGFSLWEYPSAVQHGIEEPPSAGTWYWIRLRAVGPDLALRFWETGGEEPDRWQIEGDATEHSGGWVGVGSYVKEPCYWGTFSVGTGGESAPMPPDGEPS